MIYYHKDGSAYAQLHFQLERNVLRSALFTGTRSHLVTVTYCKWFSNELNCAAKQEGRRLKQNHVVEAVIIRVCAAIEIGRICVDNGLV